jgi:uncharacterized protein (TIGR03435 family)
MRIAAILLSLLAATAPAQAPHNQPMVGDAKPVFAVATIKPSDPSARGKGTRIKGRNFATINTTLSYLIQYAYGVQERQILGGPEWLDKDKYDISAVTDMEGQINDDQWKIMLQQLLANRFALSFHRDTRKLSIYVLVVGKNGPKLSKSELAPNDGANLRFSRGSAIRLPARNATMDDFAHLIQRNMVDRPVVDRTGLTGSFDFTLTFTPNDYQFASIGGRLPVPPPGDNPPPELFTAIQQQLGLILKPTKAKCEILAIEHVEKPSAN